MVNLKGLCLRLEPFAFDGLRIRILKDFKPNLEGFHLSTYLEVSMGSGLEGSSTLVVSILNAFSELYQLPLGGTTLQEWLMKLKERKWK